MGLLEQSGLQISQIVAEFGAVRRTSAALTSV